jgi:hypothetical protein
MSRLLAALAGAVIVIAHVKLLPGGAMNKQ